jgi:hypothetical protein
MKSRLATGLILSIACGGQQAMAACSGTQITDAGGSGSPTTYQFTFGTLNNNKTLTIGGLSLKAGAGGMSNVATNWSSLPANTTAATANTLKSNTLGTGSSFTTGTLIGWSSGSASSSSVTFTSAANGNLILPWSTNQSSVVTNLTTTPGSPISLSNLLQGNTACVGSPGSWQAQEYHQSGGDLIDWKLGLSDTVDPTSSVGSWSISGTGASTTVDYVYGPNTYHDKVWDHGNGTYSFCDQGNNETVATIKPGQGPCP